MAGVNDKEIIDQDASIEPSPSAGAGPSSHADTTLPGADEIHALMDAAAAETAGEKDETKDEASNEDQNLNPTTSANEMPNETLNENDMPSEDGADEEDDSSFEDFADQAAASASPVPENLWHWVSLGSIWAGVLLTFGALLVILFSPQAASSASWALLGGIGLVAGLFLVGSITKVFSPALLSGAMLRQASGKGPREAGQLAGADMLSVLQLAEKILDTDDQARLITRRDGVVTYANSAYLDLARMAGVMGPAGLPPRIDRLFGGQGAEATKLFRLCRAARSGSSAEESIYQLMGLEDGGVRRRFNVSIHPVSGAGEYISWTLRELPVEEEEQDVLASAYADFTAPVFALEKSGQIAWANAAMRNRLGASRGTMRHIDDVVLGETREIVSRLWQVDQTNIEAMVRQRFGDPIEASFRAFRRGGVGEGFVCISFEAAAQDEEADEVSVSGDMTEAPFGVAVIEGEIGRDAKIVEANKAFTEVFGGKAKNAPLAKSLESSALDDLAEEIKRKANASGAPRPVEASVGDGDKAKHFAIFARPVKRRRGSYGVRRTILYSVDISDRKLMEQDHAQDQKLKAIGHLAGEVAHDFNNLLQVVMGNCEHLMLRHPAGDPAYQELVLIRENAQRAANMTKQLLAYSRKQTLTRKVQSITDILLDFSRFLDRAVGEKVKLDLVNGRGLPPVKVDRNQLETAIMNLAVNARDAMAPDGGRVTITTRLMAADEVKEANISGLDPQDHVVIEVADTGAGVPQNIVDQIFDPFFTTKAEGKGTGLGLSTVYGVIGQMGGAIQLHNEEGKGATFRIFLPAFLGDIEAEDEEVETGPAPSGDYTGTGRILVVEDEAPVRAFVVATLERSGYEVTSVEDGIDALELFEEGDTDFDVVISDIMMPEVDGPTLVERARSERDLTAGIIFMSGYAESNVREQLDKIADADYLQKPFPMAVLGAKVKEVLAARSN